MPSFLERADRSLLLFGGKGGVGKTTCAAATACRLAQRFPQQTFLLVSTDPAHSLGDSFAGPAPFANLHYRELDCRASLQRFQDAHGRHLRAIALEGTFLDEEDVGPLLKLSIPGFDELMAFHEIATLVEEHAYGCIIIDTAPTGHTLRFLELPELMRQWVDALDAMRGKHRYLARLYSGAYRKDDTDLFLEDLSRAIGRLAFLLSAPERCLFVPVMLAEALSTRQTQRLVCRLKQMNVPVEDIVVNRLYPARTACAVCIEVHRRQQCELREALAVFAGYQMWGVPLQGGEVRGAEQLACFWNPVARIEAAEAAPLTGPCLPPRVDRPAPLPGDGVRLLLCAGKGGVGKTTIACATALRLARAHAGKRVLLFSTDPAHSLADCFDVPIGARATILAKGLTALEIDAAAEFQKLKDDYLEEVKSLLAAALDRSGIDLEFDRDVIQRLLELAPPGLDEVMALLRAVEMLETNRYDILVLDTAPTGHLIRFLELPELIQDWLKVMFGLFLKYKNVLRLPRISEFLVGLSKKLKHLRSLLSDPRSGQLHAVSILTEMACEETCDLLAACRRVGIAVPVLFLNLATPPGDCPVCAAVAELESRVLGRFRTIFPDVAQTVVYRCGEPRRLDRLTALGQALYC